jgi:F0F1-type ATP synthase assembly protein I
VTEPGLPVKKPAGAAKYAGLGVQLAAAILLFVFLGQWLDKKLGTEALFTILGAFLGFGGTMWSLIRRLNRENREDEAKKQR